MIRRVPIRLTPTKTVRTRLQISRVWKVRYTRVASTSRALVKIGTFHRCVTLTLSLWQLKNKELTVELAATCRRL